MSIVMKIKQVQKVFEQLEQEMGQHQQRTGLYCLSNCGQCCSTPNVEATVLEFMPFAFDLFLQRQTAPFLERLEQAKTSASATCILFNALSTATNAPNYITGRCSQYQYRGLICRLFGHATVRDKLGIKRLTTCKPLKATGAESMETLNDPEIVNAAPNFGNYYQQLVKIDFRLGQERLPINQALRKAIEEVEFYYQYRPFPYRHRRSA